MVSISAADYCEQCTRTIADLLDNLDLVGIINTRIYSAAGIDNSAKLDVGLIFISLGRSQANCGLRLYLSDASSERCLGGRMQVALEKQT